MAKRRRKEAVTISFFSFLDIMTATMGTLVLILICVTLVALKMDKKKIHIKLKSDKTDKLIKKPIFVECTKDKLIIYPQNYETRGSDIHDRKSYFMRLLYNLNRNEHYIIFAIRPDGYGIFKKARIITESKDIGVGYEPIDRYWELTLDRGDLPAPMLE